MNDLSSKLEAITSECNSTLMCAEYEELGLDRTECMNNAEDRAAELWGFTEKDCIMEYDWHKYKFTDVEKIEIKVKDSFISSDIKIAKSPLFYACSISVMTPNEGFASPISVYNNEQFLTKEEAIEYGFEKFMEGCRRIKNSFAGQLMKKAEELKEIYMPMQMSLFA